MPNKPLDQFVGSASASVAPIEPSRFQLTLLLVVGIAVGLLPLGLAAVFYSAGNEFLHESWLASGLILCVVEWVVAAVMRATSIKKNLQTCAKGIMWGLGVSTSAAVFGLLAIAYYILTF
jgi:small-conductance mechanosensitive channel